MHAQTSTVTGPPVVTASNIAFSQSVPTSNARHVYGGPKIVASGAGAAGRAHRRRSVARGVHPPPPPSPPVLFCLDFAVSWAWGRRSVGRT